MATFITQLTSEGSGPTLALKDLIDLCGVPTTAGSRAVARLADPAVEDAPLLAGARQAGARIVGKTNLYELAFGASGVNPFFGTPRNPLGSTLLPGGSSSGSAVAVATGEAEVAYGSDSGGSVRVPAAFCGVAGLKTTHGRVALDGVYPLAPSLDTIGPMARDVAGLILGMQLLEPGFLPSAPASGLGLVKHTGVAIDPAIQQGIESACHLVEIPTSEVHLPAWREAFEAGSTILHAEAVRSNHHLIEDASLNALLSDAVRERLAVGANVTEQRHRDSLGHRSVWRAALDEIFARVELLVLPTVGFFPPPLEEAFAHVYTDLTMPLNLAGYPAVSIPVPAGGRLPASLQLLGPPNSEELLLATAAQIERAAARTAD